MHAQGCVAHVALVLSMAPPSGQKHLQHLDSIYMYSFKKRERKKQKTVLL